MVGMPPCPCALAMARVAGLSPYHFHRLFRGAFGQTPHEYVRARRREAPIAVLRQGRAANEACAEAGLMSVSSFSRAFRARFGHSPGATQAGIGVEFSNLGQSPAVTGAEKSTP
jgi:AraC-like DNA-binding protein